VSVHVPTADVARFVARGTLDGKDVETSMFMRRLVPPITQANLDTEVARVRLFWDLFITGQLASDLTMREIFAEDLTAGSTITSTATVFVAHGSQGIAAPNHIAISFRLVGTALPRPWQWLVRLFGVPDSKVVGNDLDVSWADALRLGIRDRYTLQGAFGWRWSAVSTVAAGVPLAAGIAYDVTDLAVGSYTVAPMRRRLPGR
jgi:hypothetical protein